MTERLLQYIWQLQYFNQYALTTAEGETLSILYPGNINTNQGPDFSGAKIKVDSTTWVGNIELHIRSTHWNNHKHSTDTNYRNVILHVVWINDAGADLPFPVLELQTKVSKLLLLRFDELMHAQSFIPCEKMIRQATPFLWLAWKQRLLIERLEAKAALLSAYLAQNNNHWEETCWWLLARNFGATVNSDAFEKIARSLPLNTLAKHKNQLHQTEALLFGQAGLLENDFSAQYPLALKKQYNFLQKKYRLQPAQVPIYFLRMRPCNFPTVRLAQLAMLVHRRAHLFSVIRETVLLKDIKLLFAITASDYWHYHYTFGEQSSYKEKKLGIQMTDSIMINTVIPILFAYGHHHKEPIYKERALQWLEQLKAENNQITSGYSLHGVDNKNAFDSQALIQLKNNYCNQKRCLECAIGNQLVRPGLNDTDDLPRA